MSTLLPAPTGWPSILLERVVRTGAGESEPLTLKKATRGGAFDGLRHAVRDLGPAGTIALVAASGLRGRGGSGYPTGDKWRACAATDAPRRYVVGNGYSADPAARGDIELMVRDPYAVLEGAAIAAFAVGATEAIIAVRAEATSAIEALGRAISDAVGAGHIGPDALGSGVSITVSVRVVQGAYMLGEETVLLKALEGRRGQPEQRPPHPAVSGLSGMPTIVQNVQTLAAAAWILRNGPDAFRESGSSGSPGTILVTVRGAAGDGVAEVPLGAPLREIVGLAGRRPAGRALKAVLVGGPSGGILPADEIDTAYDFEPLRAVGAHIGSGSVVVADDRACIVDLARLLTRFCADEACGKTIPCRIGTRRLLEIGDRIAEGRPRPSDVDLLADLASDIVGSGLCDHERLATLPLTSGLRYFRAELDAHILRSSCPAGVCRPIAVAAAAAT
ncbi:MAG TPA: NADH-ubiquinone oxidoreductase-F iron-sulfur binding region domain-containing protein [Candidatus Limnocylindrales bacterium]